MKIFNNPNRTTWTELTARPALELDFLESTVKNILNRVKLGGDAALKELTFQLDGAQLDSLLVSQSEITAASEKLSVELKQAIITAQRNIEVFHASQIKTEAIIETMPGVNCWRRAVAIDKVGIYIPGGTAPLFSTVLMLGTPAKLAGCKEVILCTPPDKSGKVNPAILFAANLVGVTKIIKVGGAQAIAALAYGTESVSKVYKIFGPGNQYVTMAKQLVNQQGTAIDMPAGPSEVLVMADESAEAAFVAADLLSQAEHGTDSQVMLVLLDQNKLKDIQAEVEKQLALLPRKKIATQALENSRVVQFDVLAQAIDFVNEYAPEHLIINVKNDEEVAAQITNAGSVFLGNYTPEAAGDYASGTNHTLPTSGYAKAYAGVSLDSFVKNITYQRISKEGIQNIGPSIEQMADAEQLVAHKRAVSVRLEKLLTRK
jgi:histidinol dehydrogenase